MWPITFKFPPWFCGWPTNHITGFKNWLSDWLPSCKFMEEVFNRQVTWHAWYTYLHCKNSTSTEPKIIQRFRVCFFGQFDDHQNRWQRFFFFFYPRVNLKTTFPVHKSSFCVRILLPPELHALSSFSALLLTLLLIRFMGDKSGGASAKAAPTSSSCRHTKTHSIYIRTVSSGSSRILTQKLDLWTGKVVFKLTLGWKKKKKCCHWFWSSSNWPKKPHKTYEWFLALWK